MANDFNNEYYYIKALGNCSPNIENLVTDFFKKGHEALNSSHSSYVRSTMGMLYSLASAIASNTVSGEEISPDNLIYLEAMFKELELILMQILTEDDQMLTRDKIDGLDSFFNQNIDHMATEEVVSGMRILQTKKEGLVFSNYKYLFIVMHVINEQFSSLIQRGFLCGKVISPFMSAMYQSGLQEEEKFELLMGLLGGTKKIQPRILYQVCGFQIVHINNNTPFVINEDLVKQEEFALKPVDDVIPTNEEGANKMLAKLFATTMPK